MIMPVLRDGTFKSRFGLLTLLADGETKSLTITQGSHNLAGEKWAEKPSIRLSFDYAVTFCGALALASATGDLISTRREFPGYARFHPVFVASDRRLGFIEAWQEHPQAAPSADGTPVVTIDREEIAKVIQVIGDLL